MKTRTFYKIAVVIAAVLVCFLWVKIHDDADQQLLKRGLPPGYILQCDASGRYRACRASGSPLLDFRDPSSKGAALGRAWAQYDYESKLAAEKWTNQ